MGDWLLTGRVLLLLVGGSSSSGLEAAPATAVMVVAAAVMAPSAGVVGSTSPGPSAADVGRPAEPRLFPDIQASEPVHQVVVWWQVS